MRRAMRATIRRITPPWLKCADHFDAVEQNFGSESAAASLSLANEGPRPKDAALPVAASIGHGRKETTARLLWTVFQTPRTRPLARPPAKQIMRRMRHELQQAARATPKFAPQAKHAD
jgi:hypothetical protein